MRLDLINSLFNSVKENKFVKNFIRELSNKLENDSEFHNLLLDDLVLYNKKITAKFRDKMLIERNNILQNYAKSIDNNKELLYVYDISKFSPDSYNLCACNTEKRNEVITKQIKELPKGVTLGSVLKKQDIGFVLDTEETKIVGEKINAMIKEKIEEQQKYLDSKRIDGHTYEVGEKYSGRIWLYDLNNDVKGGMEGFEEIEFPEDLYETAKSGDLFIYTLGKYEKYIQ